MAGGIRTVALLIGVQNPVPPTLPQRQPLNCRETLAACLTNGAGLFCVQGAGQLVHRQFNEVRVIKLG